VCVSTVVHNTAQSSSDDYLPSYPPDKHQTRAQMLSTGREENLKSPAVTFCRLPPMITSHRQFAGCCCFSGTHAR